MSEIVTVYSKPNCVQCTGTYRFLDNAGIEYRVVDLNETPSALEYVTEDLGYSQAPVVVVDDHNHWSGLRPDKIAALAAAMKTT